jgi:hypothetical protein
MPASSPDSCIAVQLAGRASSHPSSLSTLGRALQRLPCLLSPTPPCCACRGDPGLKSEFATRLAGSADLYHKNQRKPFHSVNFIIAHDGFTLADFVSYNEKHNDQNGEDNREAPPRRCWCSRGPLRHRRSCSTPAPSLTGMPPSQRLLPGLCSHVVPSCSR